MGCPRIFGKRVFVGWVQCTGGSEIIGSVCERNGEVLLSFVSNAPTYTMQLSFTDMNIIQDNWNALQEQRKPIVLQDNLVLFRDAL